MFTGAGIRPIRSFVVRFLYRPGNLRKLVRGGDLLVECKEKRRMVITPNTPCPSKQGKGRSNPDNSNE